MATTAPFESSALDEMCAPFHIAQISERIDNWEELAPYFNLTLAEEQEIRASHAHQYKLQKRKMLWKWVKKEGKEATYRKLKHVFEQAREALLAAAVEEVLQDVDSHAPHKAMNSFQLYLKDCYSASPATSAGGREWPPFSDAPFVDPVLKVEDKKIEVKELFKSRKFAKVLLEGVAGSGKTTLAKHICQQWADGKLLQDVDLLIHLTLADPTLCSAHSLQDIIPHPTAEIRKAVADVMVERRGKRCCFVMDGWEDLPEKMQQSSFILSILEGKKPGVALPNCSFIVTSRPIASASLKLVVTTTVEITGFAAESVDSYATQYLTQQGKDPTVFITALNDNPPTRGLSSLPINAAILLHLFLAIQTGLPSTQTELFKCFLLNLILHHLVAKTDHNLCRLLDFADLPENIKKSLHKLCHIAHYATFSSKAASQSSQLLSFNDLCQEGLQDFQDTLGLMKVHQQLTWFGYDPHYGFLHSSVQDFLCAVRMSQLRAEEQVRDFKRIVSNNPTSLILSFYAGITRLENRGVRECLYLIGMNPPDNSVINDLFVTRSEVYDCRRLFLAYLHCLYEAKMQNLLVKPAICCVDFQHYRLSVHDLNIIWYYILDMVRLCYPSQVLFGFHDSFDGDHAIESAVTTLVKQAHAHQSNNRTGCLGLVVSDNNLTHKGVVALARLLHLDNIKLDDLTLGGDLESPLSSGFITLKTLIEALSLSRSTNFSLTVSNCKFTSRHAYHLLLLVQGGISYLNISWNLLDECVPLLVSVGSNLKELDISLSGIGCIELIQVGLILQSNTNLKTLFISSNTFLKESMDDISHEVLCRFIELIVAPSSRSRLELLCTAACYAETIKCDRIQSALNRFGLRRGYPLEVRPFKHTDVGMQITENYCLKSWLPSTLLTGKT